MEGLEGLEGLELAWLRVRLESPALPSRTIRRRRSPPLPGDATRLLRVCTPHRVAPGRRPRRRRERRGEENQDLFHRSRRRGKKQPKKCRRLRVGRFGRPRRGRRRVSKFIAAKIKACLERTSRPRSSRPRALVLERARRARGRGGRVRRGDAALRAAPSVERGSGASSWSSGAAGVLTANVGDSRAVLCSAPNFGAVPGLPLAKRERCQFLDLSSTTSRVARRARADRAHGRGVSSARARRLLRFAGRTACVQVDAQAGNSPCLGRSGGRGWRARA